MHLSLTQGMRGHEDVHVEGCLDLSTERAWMALVQHRRTDECFQGERTLRFLRYTFLPVQESVANVDFSDLGCVDMGLRELVRDTTSSRSEDAFPNDE